MTFNRSFGHKTLAAAAALCLSFALVACSDSDGGSSSEKVAAGPAAAEAALNDGRTALDLRSGDEFETGHIEGATNIDLEDKNFKKKIKNLDTQKSYVVYSRGGADSAKGAKALKAIDVDVVDGGSIDDMIVSGWPSSGTS